MKFLTLLAIGGAMLGSLASNGINAFDGNNSQTKNDKAKLEALHAMLPNVKSSLSLGTYERILMTKLRDKNTTTAEYRHYVDLVAEVLVVKVVECLTVREFTYHTPLQETVGVAFAQPIELVSVMRAGDALLNVFTKHFPDANISKFLVQRDEETAKPIFKYMKPSPTIASGRDVVITEPMIATGGSLITVIKHLIDLRVPEDKIIIAGVCAAPEGILAINAAYPQVRIVLIALDERLNEKKYIVPGLGDFGDRYFGT